MRVCLSKHCCRHEIYSLLSHPKSLLWDLLFFNVVVSIKCELHTILHFMSDSNRTAVTFYSKQMGIRKQETERINIKVMAHCSWRGRYWLDVYRSKAQYIWGELTKCRGGKIIWSNLSENTTVWEVILCWIWSWNGEMKTELWCCTHMFNYM